ncbi:MAG: hypothetical protein P8175_00505 [Deltaproteobacteria bacterium]|jgi:hypothetical protein
MGFALPPFGRELIRFSNSANYNVFRQGWQHDTEHVYKYMNNSWKREDWNILLRQGYGGQDGKMEEWVKVKREYRIPQVKWCYRNFTGQAADSRQNAKE